MNVPKYETVRSNKHYKCEEFIKKHYIEFWQFLQDNYPTDTSFLEKLYWYYHNIKEYPRCIECGERVNFNNFNKGYLEFCSNKCVNESSIVKNRRSKTTKEHYGVENPSQDANIQQKKKDTCLKRYGKEFYQLTEEHKRNFAKTCLKKYGAENPFSSAKIKEKIKKTNNERYGVDYPQQNKDIRQKTLDTCKEKYGVEIVLKNTDIRAKINNTRMEKYGTIYVSQSNIIKRRHIENYIAKHPDVVDIQINDDGSSIYKCKCPHPDTCNKCNKKTYEASQVIYSTRKYEGYEPCTIINPPSDNRISGTHIENTIRMILDDAGVEYLTNYRKLIGRQEVDIYIPSKNIAIECNGIFYHASNHKKRIKYDYHYNKWKMCYDQQIDLYTFWEDWFMHNPQYIEDLLINKLGLCANKIPMSKCRIEKIRESVANDYINALSLGIFKVGNVNLGLFFKDALIGILSATEQKCGEWNIDFFNINPNYSIFKGYQKFISYFIQNYNPSKIIAVCPNDLNEWKIYQSIGFTKLHDNDIRHWYISNKYERYDSTKYNNQTLIKEYGGDSSLSEDQNLNKLFKFKINKIYDSGNSMWVLNIQ